MAERNGITAAGNWIIDYAKTIDDYPAQDTLATILSVSSSSGGAAYNVLMDLARMEAPFPLSGIGLIGDDAAGQKVLEDCRRMGIDHQQVRTIGEAGTAYTDVMIARETGRRTFFTYRGANAYLGPGHFDFGGIVSKILHVGYPLLLDKLDAFMDEKLTNLAHVLKKALEEGLVTSLDLVSIKSDRFREIVIPSLPYVDLLFLNEFEASQLTGVDLTAGHFSQKDLEATISKLFGMGVRTRVILHFPEGVVAAGPESILISQGSVMVPREMIQGTPGAGDALAAGVLYGIHEGWTPERSLIAGVCVAAASLTEKGCSDGVKPLADCLRLGAQYGYRKMPI